MGPFLLFVSPIEPSTVYDSHSQITCLKEKALWELTVPVAQSDLCITLTEQTRQTGRLFSCVGHRASAHLKTVTTGREGSLQSAQKQVTGWTRPVGANLPAAAGDTPVFAPKPGQ